MKKLHIILVLLLLAFVSPTFAQKTKGKTKKQLQSEINSLQKEISTANQLLKIRYNNIRLNEKTTFPLKITDKMERIRLLKKQ